MDKMSDKCSILKTKRRPGNRRVELLVESLSNQFQKILPQRWKCDDGGARLSNQFQVIFLRPLNSNTRCGGLHAAAKSAHVGDICGLLRQETDSKTTIR